jgi:hypothetical protein
VKCLEVLNEFSFMVVGSTDSCGSASAVTGGCVFSCAWAVTLVTSNTFLTSEVTLLS